jgi:hypothetical protein
MLRCLIAMACSLWVTCCFCQSSTPIFVGSTEEIVCRSESEEIVLHATASATLPVVDILSCGDHVTVMARKAGWYRVRTQGGKEGYVKDLFFTKTLPVRPPAAQSLDAAALEAQYKTCTKHYIPADKCTPEIYRQLKEKDEAPLDPAVASALQAVKRYRPQLSNPASLLVRGAYVMGGGVICLEILGQNNMGGMSTSWVTYSDTGKWLGEAPCDETGLNVTEQVNQALKDGR